MEEKAKTKQLKVKISDELAELGYYARSMKPRKGWLDQRTSLLTFPSIFYLKAFPSSIHIVTQPHLRRIYPRGTRIQSSNFAPEVYWRSGMQVASLNWQRCDAGMQVD